MSTLLAGTFAASSLYSVLVPVLANSAIFVGHLGADAIDLFELYGVSTYVFEVDGQVANGAHRCGRTR